MVKSDDTENSGAPVSLRLLAWRRPPSLSMKNRSPSASRSSARQYPVASLMKRSIRPSSPPLARERKQSASTRCLLRLSKYSGWMR